MLVDGGFSEATNIGVLPEGWLKKILCCGAPCTIKAPTLAECLASVHVRPAVSSAIPDKKAGERKREKERHGNEQESGQFVDRTPTHNTHVYSTVCSQARDAHHALGTSHTDCSVIFVRLKRICHLVLHLSHPLLFSHLTSSSSFTRLPRHQNTQHNRDHTTYSKNTQYIMNLSRISQPTRSAIKSHSGAKT